MLVRSGEGWGPGERWRSRDARTESSEPGVGNANACKWIVVTVVPVWEATPAWLVAGAPLSVCLRGPCNAVLSPVRACVTACWWMIPHALEWHCGACSVTQQRSLMRRPAACKCKCKCK